MKKPWLLLMSFLLLFMVGQQVLAFSDTQTSKNADKIKALKEAGVIKGEGNEKFNPEGKLTYAAGISLIVRGLDISLARYQFIKAPLASDYYKNIKDNEWYSEAFINAQVNGLDIPKDVKYDQVMTREQFAHHLFRAVEANNQHAYIEIFVQIQDEKDITKAYMDSIQKLLISKIITLDSQQQFHPQTIITRGEAAAWLYEARKFVKNNAGAPNPDPQQNPLSEFTIQNKAVNGSINEITVSAQAPHPGYGIRIATIQFNGDQAVIYTEPIWPNPDRMYPLVISTVTAVTYVASNYKPVLAETISVPPSMDPIFKK